jgi:hypothetical protein
MLFTVPTTGGFLEKILLVLKIHTKKSAKQENSNQMKAFCRKEKLG